MSGDIGAIGDIIAVLVKNSDDVEELVRRFGGVSNMVKAGPAIYRIVKTIAERNKERPDEVADQVEKALFYNDETRERIHAFQKKNGLKADGIVGNLTWNKVEELLKGKANGSSS